MANCGCLNASSRAGLWCSDIGPGDWWSGHFIDQCLLSKEEAHCRSDRPCKCRNINAERLSDCIEECLFPIIRECIEDSVDDCLEAHRRPGGLRGRLGECIALCVSECIEDCVEGCVYNCVAEVLTEKSIKDNCLVAADLTGRVANCVVECINGCIESCIDECREEDDDRRGCPSRRCCGRFDFVGCLSDCLIDCVEDCLEDCIEDAVLASLALIDRENKRRRRRSECERDCDCDSNRGGRCGGCCICFCGCGCNRDRVQAAETCPRVIFNFCNPFPL